MNILSSQSTSGQASEVQDLFARFTIDAGSEFLFGCNVDTLSGTLPQPGQPMGAKGSSTSDTWGSFAQAFEQCQQVATARGRMGYLWPLFELTDKNAPHAKVVHAWLEPLVNQALQEKANSKMTGFQHDVKEKNFLQHLADSTDGMVLTLKYSDVGLTFPRRSRSYS
jgi:hypothetical protein